MKKYLFMLVVMLSVAVGAVAQDIMEVTGTITDTKGEPLIGATVTVKDQAGLGSIANIDGIYKIKVKQYQTLVFSYKGGASQKRHQTSQRQDGGRRGQRS